MIVLLIALIAGSPHAVGSGTEARSAAIVQAQPDEPPLLQVGEELEYIVRYSFFDIGRIRFRIISKETHANRPVYRAAVYMDSDPSLGWLLNVHIRFYGLMDSLIFSHTWLSEDSTASDVSFRSMLFDYSRNQMLFTKGNRTLDGFTTVTQRDTVEISGPSQDGMSLFFFAREYVRSSWKVDVPTFMDTREEQARIRFTGERRSVRIEAVPYPIETMYLDGTADFVGVFGVTGDYEGWFTNDAARIPVFAKMKVVLGSVEVELVKWTRKGWSPPPYVR